MKSLSLRRSLDVFLLFAAIACCLQLASASVGAQTTEISEMELINRVEELQVRLDADQITERDAAQAELIELGPSVLDHLDDPDEGMSTDLRQRLVSVRKELEAVVIREVAKPSLVTLSGTLTVDESLRIIGQQTGNDVLMSDDTPIESGSQSLTWKNEALTFWQAMSQLQQQAKLTIDPYAGDARKLRLVPIDAAVGGDGAADSSVVRASADLFDIQITRIDASKNLLNPKLGHVSVQLVVRWEPRLRPISLKLAAEKMKAVGSDDQPLPVSNPQAVFSGLVQPQIPQLEMIVPLKPIPRAVTEIKTLTATLEAILPGRVETFRFKEIGKQNPGRRIEKAGAVVTFERIEKNEDLYGVSISLAFDEELNALESHQSWVFENPVYLESPQGERSTPLTFETVRQDNSGVTVTYYFAEQPTDQTLVYQTPAAIVQTLTVVELNNIPLP